MDAIGDLVGGLAAGFAGMVAGAFQAFGDAVRAVVHALQSVLPGPWLPIVAVVVVLLVGWSLVKR